VINISGIAIYEITCSSVKEVLDAYNWFNISRVERVVRSAGEIEYKLYLVPSISAIEFNATLEAIAYDTLNSFSDRDSINLTIRQYPVPREEQPGALGGLLSELDYTLEVLAILLTLIIAYIVYRVWRRGRESSYWDGL